MRHQIPVYIILNPALTGEGLRKTLAARKPPAPPRPAYTRAQVDAMLREPCCGPAKRGGA
jgi:hypothetical protein